MKNAQNATRPIIKLILANTTLFLILLSSCSKNSKNTADTTTEAESQVKAIGRQWAETAVTGDTTVIKTILANDFIGTSPEGILYTKQDFINDMKAHPSAFTSNVVNDIKVRFFSNVAVAQGNETFTRKNGEVARFVWTDVLIQRNSEWQVVAAQDVIAPATTQLSSEGLFLNPVDNNLAGVDSARKAYVSAWLAADADQIAQLYTNDALVLYPNQPAVVGRAAILTYFKDFFHQFPLNEFELTSEEVQIIGSLAIDRGKYKWKGSPKKGGVPINDYGKYLVILKRQPDGSWKVARDMDNSDRSLSQTTRGQG
jgi:uncharacterized protein (TIGR02246 family)